MTGTHLVPRRRYSRQPRPRPESGPVSVHQHRRPNAHIVDGYPQNIMPQNYTDLLSQEDIADVVSYLLAQHE